MYNTICIFGREFESDFLSGWIKYNRIEAGISQEALAYGICSTSHLSYFENGKKMLRAELIEALLKKLKLSNISQEVDIGLVRQKFHRLMFQIEGFDYESASSTYSELMKLEAILAASPYNIEFNIYKLMFNALVERRGYNELKKSIDSLDKIYESLNSQLQHIFMLVTGKFLYDNLNHCEGIRRLEKALRIKETPWINYRLGVAYRNNLEFLRGIFYLEKALNVYSNSGNYRNSLECHSFLGLSYMELNMFEQAEKNFISVLNGSNYFTLNKNLFGVYTNLANLYLKMKKYNESITYCEFAMDEQTLFELNNPWAKASWISKEQPIMAACIYIEVHKELGELWKCNEMFDKYLIDSNKQFIYYKYLYCLYLSIFHFREDLFYEETENVILPYYKSIGFLNIYKNILILLIKHLESRRKYKEANNLYKEILNITYH